jgi:hypothetical protein
MKLRVALLGIGLLISSVPPVQAYAAQAWAVTSPYHGQTFAYGTEWRRAWATSPRGNPRHLLLFLDYTNDPYIDNSNPREYDSFSFDFPSVRLQPDGRTFSYLAPNGRLIPVALKSSGFLGIEEIRLLPTSELIIDKPHGYLTLTLRVAE